MTMLDAQTRTPHRLSGKIVTESASGLDPDRVLVFGDAVFPAGKTLAGGAGVAARSLAALTGRGVDITVVPWSGWSGQSLTGAAGALDYATYDVIIVTLPESVVHARTSSGAISSAAMELLNAIDQVRSRAHPTTQFVVALAHGERHSELAAALQASRADLVALAVDPDAMLALPRVVEVTQLLLQYQRAHAGSPQWLRDAPQPFQDRYDAVLGLGILDTGEDARFNGMVDAMAKLFKTKGAAINFVPEGRVWTKASTWFQTGSSPLQNSFCRHTVLGSGPFVVGDAWQANRNMPRNEARFYAGYPIETLDGVRVGAVCVFDPNPRDERLVELALLRDYAILARSELYKH